MPPASAEQREDSDGKFLLITASGTEYALPVSEVEAVLSLRRSDISPIPVNTGHCLRGLFNYKGSVIGLLHSNTWTVQSDENGDEALTAVLLRYETRPFAVLVDSTRTITDAVPHAGAVCVTARELYGDADDNNQ